MRSEIQSSILLAERNIDNAFAIKVLKTLFLVKYYKNFQTTEHNVSVLLLDDINIDLKKHRAAVSEALKILENQSYIQRNGQVFEFLTDDEKDVEEEIKTTEIDDSGITQFQKAMFFDEIIRDNKIQYLDGKQSYDFTCKIDGTITGREKELEIEIVTENSPDYNKLTLHQSQTMGTTCMKLVLPEDPTFMKDVRMYLKVEKYVKQHQSTSNRPEIKRILEEKARQNIDRRRNLLLTGKALLGQATVYINGTQAEQPPANDGRTLVISAFQQLIKIVFRNLRMIGNTYYTEDNVKNAIRAATDDLFGPDDSLSEAESEIIALVKRRITQSERTSISDLKSVLTKRPYGWYPNAIWTLVAKLYRRGSVELKKDSKTLDNDQVLEALLNTSNHPQTLLEMQSEVDPKAVRDLHKAYNELFDEQCPFKEAKEVANGFNDKLKDMDITVNQLLVQAAQYSFLNDLEPVSEKLNRLIEKDYSYFLNNLSEYKDELLAYKEDLLDPIRRFMSGQQKTIFDDVQSFITSNSSNIGYLEGGEIRLLNELIEHPRPYEGDLVRNAKSALDKVADEIKNTVESEQSAAVTVAEEIIKNFKSKKEFEACNPDDQNNLLQPFYDAIERLRNQQHIANIRDVKVSIQETLLPEQLNQLIKLSSKPTGGSGDKDKEPVCVYISFRTIDVTYTKSELATEEDVDEYIQMLERELKSRIRKNQRISL